jgi:hypothetical protein
MSRPELREALRQAGSALRARGPAFALAGSYALWVYGGPEPEHDVDFVVADADAESAAAVLADAGFHLRRPPEQWLFKAALSDDGPAVIDVLHHVNGVAVDAELLERAVDRDVLAVRMPVLEPTEVVCQKLRALSEHHCDFARLLPPVRAVREQLDWPALRSLTADNAFAAAFLHLCERLGLTR